MPFSADNARLIAQLGKIYDAAAARLRDTIISPPGKSDRAQAFNQARAVQLLNQVNAQIAALKRQAAQWTGAAIEQALKEGVRIGAEQVAEIFGKIQKKAESGKLLPPTEALGRVGIGGGGFQVRVQPFAEHILPTHPFALINHQAVQVLAQNTIGDLVKAANSMQATAASALRRMAATGVTNEQVNQILAGRYIIEGKPDAAIRELRTELEKIHGKQVTIPTKNGGSMTFDTDYYAKLVANGKTSEAIRVGNNDTKLAHGLDLVQIIGYQSANPCSLLIGKIFSRSGTSTKYPAFASVSHGQEPYRLFHPHCHKQEVDYIEGFSEPFVERSLKAAAAA